jgi:signal transduction histidine kinase
MQIYRITQEAVNNVCRHALPTHVKMNVSATARGEFVLRLEDNGKQFDPVASTKGEGMGLANMQARASLIDATLSWQSNPAGGTVFELRRSREKQVRSGDGEIQ